MHDSEDTHALRPIDRNGTPLEEPPVLPFEDGQPLNWVDFSQTVNPLGTPTTFSATYHHVRGVCDPLSAAQGASELPQAIAQRIGVDARCVAVSSTIDDIVRAIARVKPRGRVALPLPTRAGYHPALDSAGHDVVDLPTPERFVIPDARIAARLGVVPHAVLLANPAYPTSRLLPRPTLLSYVEACDWVIVDERGIELTMNGESMVPLVAEHPNLVVLQTFTEAYAMAATPMSYCVASPQLIEEITPLLSGPSSPAFACAIAQAALRCTEHLDRTRDLLDSEIPWMQCMLSLVPGITIFPAEANFVLCSYKPGAGMTLGAPDAPSLIRRLQKAGFLVRALDHTPGLEPHRYFCVGVRTRHENKALIAALRTIVLSRDSSC